MDRGVLRLGERGARKHQRAEHHLGSAQRSAGRASLEKKRDASSCCLSPIPQSLRRRLWSSLFRTPRSSLLAVARQVDAKNKGGRTIFLVSNLAGIDGAPARPRDAKSMMSRVIQEDFDQANTRRPNGAASFLGESERRRRNRTLVRIAALEARGCVLDVRRRRRWRHRDQPAAFVCLTACCCCHAPGEARMRIKRGAGPSGVGGFGTKRKKVDANNADEGDDAEGRRERFFFCWVESSKSEGPKIWTMACSRRVSALCETMSEGGGREMKNRASIGSKKKKWHCWISEVEAGRAINKTEACDGGVYMMCGWVGRKRGFFCWGGWRVFDCWSIGFWMVGAQRNGNVCF